MKVQVGHMDTWRKKSLALMECDPGDLTEDAVSGLRQEEWVACCQRMRGQTTQEERTVRTEIVTTAGISVHCFDLSS